MDKEIHINEKIKKIFRAKLAAKDPYYKFHVTPDPSDKGWKDAFIQCRGHGIPIQSLGDTSDKMVFHPGHMGYEYKYYLGDKKKWLHDVDDYDDVDDDDDNCRWINPENKIKYQAICELIMLGKELNKIFDVKFVCAKVDEKGRIICDFYNVDVMENVYMLNIDVTKDVWNIYGLIRKNEHIMRHNHKFVMFVYGINRNYMQKICNGENVVIPKQFSKSILVPTIKIPSDENIIKGLRKIFKKKLNCEESIYSKYRLTPEPKDKLWYNFCDLSKTALADTNDKMIFSPRHYYYNLDELCRQWYKRPKYSPHEDMWYCHEDDRRNRIIELIMLGKELSKTFTVRFLKIEPYKFHLLDIDFMVNVYCNYNKKDTNFVMFVYGINIEYIKNFMAATEYIDANRTDANCMNNILDNILDNTRASDIITNANIVECPGSDNAAVNIIVEDTVQTYDKHLINNKSINILDTDVVEKLTLAIESMNKKLDYIISKMN